MLTHEELCSELDLFNRTMREEGITAVAGLHEAGEVVFLSALDRTYVLRSDRCLLKENGSVGRLRGSLKLMLAQILKRH